MHRSPCSEYIETYNIFTIHKSQKSTKLVNRYTGTIDAGQKVVCMAIPENATQIQKDDMDSQFDITYFADYWLN